MPKKFIKVTAIILSLVFSLMYPISLSHAGTNTTYGVFNKSIINGYQRVSYTNAKTAYDVYIYKGTKNQSIAPIIRTTNHKAYLGDLNASGINTVKAKINGSTMKGFYQSGESFYGIYYYKNVLYKDGAVVKKGFADPLLYGTKSDISSTYYPCFCIYKNGTVSIKWPTTKDDFIELTDDCSIVISGQHPLVYNGKPVYGNESSLRDLTDDSLIWGHFRKNKGYPDSKVPRTIVGHKADGTFMLVCIFNSTLKVASQLMKDLNCDYAVNMDGGPGAQMILPNSGRVSPNHPDKDYYGTAIVIYDK